MLETRDAVDGQLASTATAGQFHRPPLRLCQRGEQQFWTVLLRSSAGGPLPQRVCDPTHEDRLVERYAPQNGPKSGHEPAHLALRGTTWHYVAQECPLHLVVHPRYPSRAPALVLFDVWEDAENITGMGRELARHESDGKSAAKNGTKRGARRALAGRNWHYAALRGTRSTPTCSGGGLCPLFRRGVHSWV